MDTVNIVKRAVNQASIWHEGQVRKYTNMPYITHPIRVAHAVSLSKISSDDTIAAAYLHDVMEDCGVLYTDILTRFNSRVADLVFELTNKSKFHIPNATRKERKSYDLRHISEISRDAKIIKIFDRIDNLGEYPLDNDEATKFLRTVYLDESYLLYQVVKDSDKQLASVLLDKINEVSGQIGGNVYERGDR